MITVQFGTRAFFVTEWSFVGVVPKQRDSGSHAGLGHDIQTLLGPGGAYIPPLPRICVYLCKYKYKRVEKKLDFSQ